MPKDNLTLNWILRTVLMKFGCLLAIGIMAACVGIISLIVLKLCGFSEENARAVSSNVGDKAALILFVSVLATGSAYWIWIGYKMFKDRKLPPPLPAPPLPVPARPRPLVQTAGPLVAPPPPGNQAVSGTICADRIPDSERISENNESKKQ